MSDYYIEAVRAYQNSNKNLKHFAECCAKVDGKETQRLAQDCKVSVDVIENARNAYRLYYEMAVNLETSDIYRMWEQANFSLWVAAAKGRKYHDLQTIKEYIETANNEGMTTEQFRTELDKRSATTPDWIGRLKAIVSTLFKLRTDYKTEVPMDKRERFERAVEDFENAIKELAEAE